jgi:hypothetical protein
MAFKLTTDDWHILDLEDKATWPPDDRDEDESIRYLVNGKVHLYIFSLSPAWMSEGDWFKARTGDRWVSFKDFLAIAGQQEFRRFDPEDKSTWPSAGDGSAICLLKSDGEVSGCLFSFNNMDDQELEDMEDVEVDIYQSTTWWNEINEDGDVSDSYDAKTGDMYLELEPEGNG